MADRSSGRLQQAVDEHQAGNLREAASLYQAILKEEPERSEVWYLLAVAAHQAGSHAQSVDIVSRALAIDPDQPEYHNLLGLALMALGRPAESEASFQTAIALDNASEYFNNLGILWREQGRLDDAIGAFREAAARGSEPVSALYNLGNAYRAKQDLHSAEQCFRQARAGNPEHAHATAALGQVLTALNRSGEAIPLLECATEWIPDDAELHCDLGDARQASGDFAAALDSYGRALKLNPHLARACYSAGCAANSVSDHGAAMQYFRRAVEIVPDWPEAQHNLGKALFHLGEVDAALSHFRHAMCGGERFLTQTAIATMIPGSPEADARAVLEERRAWAAEYLPPSRSVDSRSGVKPDRPRIGYISSFFQDRNWMKPVWGLINHHDRRAFEIHLFSEGPASRIEEEYRSDARDRFHDIDGMSNEDVCALMEREKIDLLIDLNGYSAIRRLPLIAMRPARIVAAWFNMYATSGIGAYDYLIGDQVVVRPEEEEFYCEKIVRVPGSYLTFEVSYPVPPVRDAPCLTAGNITFGSFASQYKITDDVVAAWSTILLDTPGSSLFLKNRTLGAPGTRKFVLERFVRHGIPEERIRLEGPDGHYRFLERYGEIDIALDPFPYNGGTTTTEAIWQGVPVVAFQGDRWVSRTSASILQAGGLSSLVAANRESYISLATALAKDPRRIADLRTRMRKRLSASSVCDTAKFAAEMERIYTRMIHGGAPSI